VTASPQSVVVCCAEVGALKQCPSSISLIFIHTNEASTHLLKPVTQHVRHSCPSGCERHPTVWVACGRTAHMLFVH
jgi:hypothetical protein